MWIFDTALSNVNPSSNQGHWQCKPCSSSSTNQSVTNLDMHLLYLQYLQRERASERLRTENRKIGHLTGNGKRSPGFTVQTVHKHIKVIFCSPVYTVTDVTGSRNSELWTRNKRISKRVLQVEFLIWFLTDEVAAVTVSYHLLLTTDDLSQFIPNADLWQRPTPFRVIWISDFPEKFTVKDHLFLRSEINPLAFVILNWLRKKW